MSEKLLATVKSEYAAVAMSGLSTEHAGVKAVAEAFGYSAAELSSIPAAANMGLSCGNPTAMASLQPGEVVVDLGCGGGLDVFLAAAKVGPTGKAIGIDMTEAMLALARRNAEQHADPAISEIVEFHLATIDQIPLPDASVDCVISNCVINLAPDKPAVFREIARILKPGGRLAISDIALKQPLPADLAESIGAYVGCIAGAILLDDYRQGLAEATFADVEVIDTGVDLNAYASVDNQAGCCSPAMDSAASGGCCSLPVVTLGEPLPTACCTPAPATPGLHENLASLLSRYSINDYAASVKVFAVKRGEG